MKPSKYLFPFIVLVIGAVLLTTCKKDADFPRDINEDGLLDKKSFLTIEISNIDPFPTEAVVNFTIDNVEPEDTIQEKWILYWELGSTDTMHRRIPLRINFDTIPNLTPQTNYQCRIKIKTSDSVNQYFYSNVLDFKTPTISLRIDNEFIEDEQNLKVTALAIIDNYENIDNSEIETFGFIWKEILADGGLANDSVKIETNYFLNPQAISELGQFQGNYYFYDYSKDYQVKAFVNTATQGLLFSDPDTFSTKSDGDFWVNMAELFVLDATLDTTNSMPVLPPALEGAVSFKYDEMIYVALGKSPSGYNNTIYRYDPKINEWEGLGMVPMELKDRMYATVFTKGEEVYVGAGCTNCDSYEDYTWENRRNIETLKKIKEIELKDDFYQFDGSNFSTPSSFNLPEPRMAAYGFKDCVGGGLSWSVLPIEGDLEGTNNEEEQIDEGEWHDLNGNESIDTELFSNSSEIQFSKMLINGSNRGSNNKSICDMLVKGYEGLFCESCISNNNSQKLDLYFKIEKTISPNYKANFFVKTATGDKENFLQGSSPYNFCMDIELGMQSAYSTVNWKDENNNWKIEHGELTGDKPNTIDCVRMKYASDGGDDKIIWKENITNYVPTASAFADITLEELGTIWCEEEGNENNLVNTKTELYYNGEKPKYPEILNGTNLSDLYNELVANDTLFNSVGVFKSKNLDNKRYAATMWEIGSNTYLIGGDTIAPIDLSNTITNLYKLDGTSFSQDLVIDNNFKDRIHPFSFVINGKGYVGGGEFANGDPVNLDLWEFDPTASSFVEVAGCGINSLTKGVGFSANGKGYVFGNYEGKAECYVYIPKTKKGN